MNLQHLDPTKNELKENMFMFGISLVLHVIIFTAVFFLPNVNPNKKIHYRPVYHVDLVSLKPVKARPKPPPPKVKPVPPPPKVKETPKVEPPPPQKEAMPAPKEKKKTPPPPKPKEKTDEQAYTKARSAIEKLREKFQKDNLNNSGVGGLDEGISREILNLKYKQYYNMVQQKVRSEWVAPPETGSRILSADVGVVIKKNGDIVLVEIEKSSGDTYFDQSVLRAVRKAGPLPAPPETDRSGNFEMGFIFTP